VGILRERKVDILLNYVRSAQRRQRVFMRSAAFRAA
jgi:hypothetical protein